MAENNREQTEPSGWIPAMEALQSMTKDALKTYNGKKAVLLLKKQIHERESSWNP